MGPLLGGCRVRLRDGTVLFLCVPEARSVIGSGDGAWVDATGRPVANSRGEPYAPTRDSEGFLAVEEVPWATA